MSETTQVPVPQQERSISYSLEWADERVGTELVTRHLRKLHKLPPATSTPTWIAFGCIVPIIFGFMIANSSDNPIVVAASYAGLAGFTITIVSLWITLRLSHAEKVRALVLEKEKLKAPSFTMSISVNGVVVTGDVFKSHWQWKGVETILEVPDLIVFYIGSGNGLPIPKRAFPTPEACAEFVSLARQYQKGAAAEVSGTPPAQ